MSFIDIIILLIVIAGAIIGYLKGFVKQISSICGIILGLVACNLFGDWATDVLQLIIPESAHWPAAAVTVKATAHIALFIVIYLSTLLVGTLLRSMFTSLHIGAVDKACGSLLCIFKYLLCFSMLLNLWYIIHPASDTFTTRHAMNNRPFEAVLDMAPFTFGLDKMPSSTLTKSTPDNNNIATSLKTQKK